MSPDELQAVAEVVARHSTVLGAITFGFGIFFGWSIHLGDALFSAYGERLADRVRAERVAQLATYRRDPNDGQ